MDKNKKSVLIKYAICFAVAAVIVVIVFAIKGFFTDDIRENITVLSDATFTAGALFTLTAGMLFVSGEGGLIGIGYVLSRVIKAFIPMGRDTETYAQYREKQLAKEKKFDGKCILFTGLFFLALSVIFIIVWYQL